MHGWNAKSADARVLTYDIEMYEVAHVRRGADLTLVDAGVTVLRVLDLQRPLVRVWVMDGPEALVARVRVPAHGQQVDVAVPHPRNLQHIPSGHGETAKIMGAIDKTGLSIACGRRPGMRIPHIQRAIDSSEYRD